MIKGGIRSNVDYWISEKRFAGFFAYNELGVAKNKGQSIFCVCPPYWYSVRLPSQYKLLQYARMVENTSIAFLTTKV
jgi:hypothetical protein